MARPRKRKLGSATLYTKETWAKERPDMRPADYLFQINVSRLGHVIDRLHDKFCRKEFLISGPDVRVLIILKRSRVSHAPSPAELAEVQMITTGAVSKQLDRLERADFLKREIGPTGGVTVHATPKGLELADRAMSALVDNSPLGDMRGSLSDEEREQLASICEKLLLKFENF